MAGRATALHHRSFRSPLASVIVPSEYTALLWGVLLDLVVWGVLPGAVTLVGGAIVIGAGLYLIRREAGLRSRDDEPLP